MSLLSLRPGQVGGAETYVRKLVEHLPGAAGHGDRLVAVMDRDLAARLETPGWERLVVPRSARRIVADRLLEAFTPWRAVGIEAALRAAGPDATLFPQQSVFPKRAPGPAVVTVGDVQHHFHPENIPAAERAFRAGIYPYSLARAARLVAVSAATRAMLVERCGVAPEKIAVVHHGFDPSPAPAPPTDRVSAPYFFYPAASFPHKNHAALVRSYAALRRRGDVRAKLVLTGWRTPAWRGIARLARELGVSDDVVHLGFLPWAEVRRVYAGAEAVLFPSRHEGFGIPVLEAAVEFRKKVITSRLPVFAELGVPPDRQIDFSDPEALLAALRLEGPTVLERTPIGWAECARRTLAVARAAAGEPRPEAA